MTKPIAFIDARYIYSLNLNDAEVPIETELERLASNCEICEAVLAEASQVGANTVLSHDANNTITLENVAMANLHAEDFRFVA